jgi:NAD(P)-dependent dehydrogenase (short-subunit alcohol dehydrogenase family)
MTDPFSLSGKNIIITGASSGIGRSCAVMSGSRGGRVILMGRNRERLQETLEMMEGKQNHTIISADLTEYELIEKLIDDLAHHDGKIDGLINCAGVSTTLPLNMSKPDKMDQFFRTNVHSAVNLTRIVTRRANFSENGGSIIFISSVMGVAGSAGKSLYSLTKGALLAGSRSIAVELAPRKIRVNCVSPGVVESPMSKGAVYSRNQESLETIRNLHPLGLGEPEDVANACVFLLSDASRWITGTNMIVDGGYLAG